MRALFFLALAVLVVVMLLPRLAAWGRGQFGNRLERRDELVKDPVCQTYVDVARPVRGGGTAVHSAAGSARTSTAEGATRETDLGK
jgi:hypothetical protein